MTSRPAPRGVVTVYLINLPNPLGAPPHRRPSSGRGSGMSTPATTDSSLPGVAGHANYKDNSNITLPIIVHLENYHLFSPPLTPCSDLPSDHCASRDLLLSHLSAHSTFPAWSGVSRRSRVPRSTRQSRYGTSPRKRRCFVIPVSRSCQQQHTPTDPQSSDMPKMSSRPK